MKKYCVIGAFGFSDLSNATGGQPVKTRTLYELLKEKCTDAEITYVETYQWKKNIIRMLFQLIRNVRSSDVLIMLPAHNGVLVFSELLLRIKKKKTKLFYDVIGGWLPEKVSQIPKLLSNLKKMDEIWVETTTMANKLHDIGLNNVAVIPNFKMRDTVRTEMLPVFFQEPFPVCTFSRVMEEKGITAAIEAIETVNSKLKRTAVILDIYGPIAAQYAEHFAELLKSHAGCVAYKGVIEPRESSQTLRDYYALLFPTRFFTEGVPGTIIDAYAAGVPVIAAKWESFADIVVEGKTGVGYEFDDKQGLEENLLFACENPEQWNSMRPMCLEEAEKYRPEKVIEQLLNKF